MSKRLVRMWFDTDIDDDPDFLARFSEPIPDAHFKNAFVVGVDWKVRGTVEVTFLVDWEPEDQVAEEMESYYGGEPE